jgi:two-component system response regulator RegA
MTEDRRSILIVDDDDTFRTRLVRAFSDRGFETRGADTAEAAISMAQTDSPELAVVDLKMPGQNGLELIQELVRIDPTTAVVMLTGYGSIPTALEAMRLGAVYYLSKPADVDDILAAFARAELPKDRPPEAPTTVPSLARVEWEHIQRVLQDCSGNVSKAARLLGMHRRSLQRKLSKYPVSK